MAATSPTDGSDREQPYTGHKYLGKQGVVFTGLEPLAVKASYVKLESDEVTAICPVTGQPDYYTVSIEIMGGFSLESKSLKLFLESYRQLGIFAEDFAGELLRQVEYALSPLNPEGKPLSVTVEVRQKRRGGIEIVAIA